MATVPAPTLKDVRAEDLKDTGRLLALHEQAVAGGLVGSSEADRLKFVAAAEHARAVGTSNPCGLFARLVRRGWWHFATQDDEDSASRRLKAYLFGGPRASLDGSLRAFVSGGMGAFVDESVRACIPARRLSEDARLVREVRAALARARISRDPFPAFRAQNPDWTRERWDAALAELGGR